MLNKVELRASHRTSSGSTHAQVLINNKDVGILYLSHREKEALLELIHKGPFKGNVEFVSDLSDDEESSD